MASPPGRNNLCHCGSGKKYKRCCLDRDRLIERFEDAAPPQVLENAAEHPLTLVVETVAGVFVRHIPDASPLHSELPLGAAAEEATQDAAAIWGLPDFVFKAALERRGSATREVGDGIVIAGDAGLVVQVKSRESITDDEDKERRWIEKKVTQASSQANGSIRALARSPTELTNRRGRMVTMDGRRIRWTPVVVIDHPSPPACVTPELSGARPGVALLRRDWDFLFEQLKSTSAVVGYFERVAGETIALGEEPVRYYDLAQADEQAPAGRYNEALFGGKGKRRSAPILPVEPLSVEAARLVRLILEDVAVTRSEASEEQRLRMLAELDRLPVAYREETGRFLAKSLRDVTARPDGTEWRLRQIVGSDETALLGFGACSEYSELVLAAFRAWLVLRHHQLQQVTGKVAELTSTGLLLTPRHDGERTWDTTVITAVGELEFTEEELQGFESVWGKPGSWPEP